MAESTPNRSMKKWRAVLVGAAVPLAVFAFAPSAGAADGDPAESSQIEQLPPVPGPGVPGVPDPQALIDLQACLSELQELVGDTAGEPPAPAPAPADEQLPPLPGPPGQSPAPAVPDIAALNETCQAVLAALKETEVPDPGGVAPPVGG